VVKELSRRDRDMLTRMSSRPAGQKPKYHLNTNLTPKELEALNRGRRHLRSIGELSDTSDGSCAICGLAWPEWFFVSNEEWRAVVEHALQESTICRDCYDEMLKKKGLTQKAGERMADPRGIEIRPKHKK
jgi:hypothetical protein